MTEIGTDDEGGLWLRMSSAWLPAGGDPSRGTDGSCGERADEARAAGPHGGCRASCAGSRG